MRIVWTQETSEDLDAIWEYLRERSPNAARQVENSILKAVSALSDQPYVGRPGHRDGTRELLIPRYPYLVVYGVEPQVVVIYHVFHGARDRPTELDAEE